MCIYAALAMKVKGNFNHLHFLVIQSLSSEASKSRVYLSGMFQATV